MSRSQMESSHASINDTAFDDCSERKHRIVEALAWLMLAFGISLICSIKLPEMMYPEPEFRCMVNISFKDGYGYYGSPAKGVIIEKITGGPVGGDDVIAVHSGYNQITVSNITFQRIVNAESFGQ